MIQLQDPTLLRSALHIAGEWCQADSGLTFSVRNPATGEQIQIKASKKIAFRPAKELKDSI